VARPLNGTGDWNQPPFKANVLIAEDNPMNQELMKHLMNSWHFDFDIVSNGKEVIAAVQKKSYDIILMDIQMPEMDGYMATGILRNELRIPVPVIAMTAHAMPGEKEKCTGFGMNDYISKPINEGMLYDLILQYTAPHPAKAARENKQGIIDLDYLREISKGNTEFEMAMIRQFIVQVPEEIQALKSAIEQHDFQHITAIAHGLKSSVSFMGLSVKLEPVLRQIEEHASTTKNIAAVQQHFEQLQQDCQEAVAEVRSLLR